MNDCPYEQTHANYCHCGKQLTGRQTRYCSKACVRTVRANHRWTQARKQALDDAAWYACANCEYLFQRHDVQVNHIVPILGKHGHWGCWHHQDNLQVLCIDCHKQETARQRQQGYF